MSNRTIYLLCFAWGIVVWAGVIWATEAALRGVS